MPTSLRTKIVVRLIAYVVIAYGIIIIGDSLLQQFRLHPGRHMLLHINELIVAVPLVISLTFIYLGNLLLHQKHNAWIAAVVLFGFVLSVSLVQFIRPRPFDVDNFTRWRHILLPLLILTGLILERKAFRVRSDIRSFGQSLRFSLVILVITLMYGVTGFLLLDKRDFHQKITVAGAFQRTIDQFGLTTDHSNPATRRGTIFVDSLSVISIATGAYIVISLFQPLRAKLGVHDIERAHAKNLLKSYPSDIDDFFKLWPHDKLYFFDKSGHAGLAYHVARGQALIVGDPFGDSKQFVPLLDAFFELCFVNDWDPAFIHATDKYRDLYEQYDFQLQKLGEEAIVDVVAFQSELNNKYFRQIRNRFKKLNYSLEILEPPHSSEVLSELRAISNDWLKKPGREERRLMMGYFAEDYMNQCSVVVAKDADGHVQGFINLVPVFEPGMVNYDMLRCAGDAPGNCNDFLLLGLLEQLHEQGVKKLNLGLTPLAGLNEDTDDDDETLVHNVLQLVYSYGNRFYSFTGLHRFKAKYQPTWEPRYAAYRGGTTGFFRTMTVLTRTMRVK